MSFGSSGKSRPTLQIVMIHRVKVHCYVLMEIIFIWS